MNRWKVESTDYDDFRLWFVFERARHGMWWCQRGEFNTHAEALAHADRMARTVEVALPRIGSQFIHKQRATPSYDDITITKVNSNNYQIRYAEDMGADGRGIDMLADELKPVALALLAHHYRGTTP
ncbi:hypothetical protein QQA05_00365 [Corynebacterium macclintockiae]|uniref:hypothetical protein n=1 Tax=Corynebacterium macclintockiae TaxID=2913501 RepID=UPI002550FE2B|nr:hypothetical protein [Corynebacterium macclintockiae]MDK8889868.1 hypothetical protein [Corynebacterium macclintockiae]